MFQLNGSAQQNFQFPAGVDRALNYYQNLAELILYLPAISLAQDQPQKDDQFRLIYRTREMGVYDVMVICDVALSVDGEKKGLLLQPALLADLPAVKTAVQPNRTVAVGRFFLSAFFRPNGTQTDVDLSVEMVSEIPQPNVPSFVPIGMIMRMVSRVAQERLAENLAIFGRDSVAAWERKHTVSN